MNFARGGRINFVRAGEDAESTVATVARGSKERKHSRGGENGKIQ